MDWTQFTYPCSSIAELDRCRWNVIPKVAPAKSSYTSDIAEFMVWRADEGTQKAVRQFVLEAFAVEAQAQSLLDAAKRAVEIAIEQDEAAALRFLDAAEA